MFENISMSDATKWIALVFAAGFIGFFGKSLARMLLSIFQKKEASPSASQASGQIPSRGNEPPSVARTEPEPVNDSSGKDEHKAVKKALKAQEKAMKK
jgi:hypothetical protein